MAAMIWVPSFNEHPQQHGLKTIFELLVNIGEIKHFLPKRNIQYRTTHTSPKKLLDIQACPISHAW